MLRRLACGAVLLLGTWTSTAAAQGRGPTFPKRRPVPVGADRSVRASILNIIDATPASVTRHSDGTLSWPAPLSPTTACADVAPSGTSTPLRVEGELALHTIDVVPADSAVAFEIGRISPKDGGTAASDSAAVGEYYRTWRREPSGWRVLSTCVVFKP